MCPQPRQPQHSPPVSLQRARYIAAVCFGSAAVLPTVYFFTFGWPFPWTLTLWDTGLRIMPLVAGGLVGAVVGVRIFDSDAITTVRAAIGHGVLTAAVSFMLYILIAAGMTGVSNGLENNRLDAVVDSALMVLVVGPIIALRTVGVVLLLSGAGAGWFLFRVRERLRAKHPRAWTVGEASTAPPLREQVIIWLPISLLIVIIAYSVMVAGQWIQPWTVVTGTNRLQGINMSHSKQELASTAVNSNRVLPFKDHHWLADPPRLVLSSLDEPEVLVLDLVRHERAWRPRPEVDFVQAERIRFNSRSIIHRDEREILQAPHTNVQAELLFTGFTVLMPYYDFIGFSDSRTGWESEKRYFGQARLLVRTAASEEPLVELSQLLVNSPYVPSLGTLVTWLPQGDFLLIRTDSYGFPWIYVAGPFGTAETGWHRDDRRCLCFRKVSRSKSPFQ